MVLICVVSSQISAPLNVAPTNTEPQGVLIENRMEQAEIWSGWRKSWGRKEWVRALSTPGVRIQGTQALHHRTDWVPTTVRSGRRVPNYRHESFRESFNKSNIEVTFRKLAENDGSTQPPVVQMQNLFGLRRNKVHNFLAIKRQDNIIKLLNTFFSEWRLHKPPCLLDIKFNFLYYWEMGDLELCQAWIDIIGYKCIKGKH